MDTQKQPKIGVAVIITRDNTVLIGQRLSPSGYGLWSAPGGKLDFGETVEDCARRESLEEIGFVPQGQYTKIGWEDDFLPEHDVHFVTLYVHIQETSDNVAINIEPNKCSGWEWVTLEKVKSLPLWPNTFPYIEQLLSK